MSGLRADWEARMSGQTETRRAWVSDANSYMRLHTRRDCPFFPGQAREATDGDRRRGSTRMCTWCRNHQHEEMSADV